jgi:hypothetical protein
MDSGKMKWFNKAVNAANELLPPVIVRMLKSKTKK